VIVLAATGNAHKLLELRRLLPGVDVVGFGDVAAIGSDPESWDVPPSRLEETGSTFVENAVLKAVHASSRCSLPVLADDSGLCVDALGGRPGVLSARHGGPGLSDADRWRLVLQELRDVPDGRRGASYRAAIALSRGGRLLSLHEGGCAGSILREPRGSGGFGYDPIFLVEALGKSMAELTPEEKDSLSHRARALLGVREALSGGILDN
jgi:XTP/dITP diphosphohydrolase